MGVHTFPQPIGHLPLQLGWDMAHLALKLQAGPYDAFPGRDRAFGVCVRAERATPDLIDVHLPIHDFSVPDDKSQVEAALKATLLAAIEDDKPVYVGCQGGFGRTGLFLALIAKVVGVADPVAYVRAHYCKRAVETDEQECYVETFDVAPLQMWLRWVAWQAWVRQTFLWWL